MGGFFPGGYQLRSLHEFVPQDVVNTGLDEHVGYAAPGLVGDGLNDGKSAADHFDGVARLGIQQAGFQVNGDHHLRSHLTHRRRRHLFGEKSVHQKMAVMFDRKEKPGIGARSSKRRADFSLGEMNGLAGKQVRGNNRRAEFSSA